MSRAEIQKRTAHLAEIRAKKKKLALRAEFFLSKSWRLKLAAADPPKIGGR